jgi:apolipoprotein N-acyltransferase
VTAGRRRVLRPLTAAAFLGAGAVLYGLAFPPYDRGELAWIALVPLLLGVRGRSSAGAFVFGMVYGAACAAIVGVWFVPTIARFMDLPLAIAGFLGALYMFVFWGVAFGIFGAGAARLLDSRRPVRGVFLIAALWVATEFLRGRVLGHPWGLLGYTQHADVALIQIAAVTAVYGVSFVLALVNAAVSEAISLWSTGRRPLAALRPLCVAMGVAAVILIGGTISLGPEAAGDHLVAIVQTNVPPARSWTRAYTDRQITTHVSMTDGAVPDRGVSLIVWPENSVPRYLEVEPGLAAILGSVARRHDSDLLFGSPRYEDGRSFNSVRLLTTDGRNGGYYDKQELVLVAEANPLLTAEAIGPDEQPLQFSRGHGPGVLQSFVPLGVSVCQETMFPEITARAVNAGAEVLVNVANDGWLDPEHGVAGSQLFAMATFRAVETRRWLVRAATTGVSGVFDPSGRVVDSLPSGTVGVLLTRVQGRTGMTPYVRFGDGCALACVAVAAVSLLRRRGRRARRGALAVSS